jgi:catechol 2,3-dioxygenase-like lactoylglutathione lyase family enzyme
MNAGERRTRPGRSARLPALDPSELVRDKHYSVVTRGTLAWASLRERPPKPSATVERMTIQRMDHVGIVVDDLVTATAFFVELGLKVQGEGSVEGGWVDRVVGLEGIRVEFAIVETPDGHGRLELIKFHAPSGRGGDRHASANTPGIRHVAFVVDDVDAVVAGVRARGGELVGEVEHY